MSAIARSRREAPKIGKINEGSGSPKSGGSSKWLRRKYTFPFMVPLGIAPAPLEGYRASCRLLCVLHIRIHGGGYTLVSALITTIKRNRHVPEGSELFLE